MLIPVINWQKVFGAHGAKIALIALGVVLVGGGAGAATYYLWPEPGPEPPPPMETSTSQDDIQYLASKDFNRLPMDQRLEWIEGAGRKMINSGGDDVVGLWQDLDPAQRKQIRDNMESVMRERVRRQADRYHKLSGEERTAFLDKQIEEMEQWRPVMHKMMGRDRHWRQRPAESPEEERFRREERASREARFREGTHHFLVEETGDGRAKSVAYFAALGKRRMEKGFGRFFGRTIKPKKKGK